MEKPKDWFIDSSNWENVLSLDKYHFDGYVMARHLPSINENISHHDLLKSQDENFIYNLKGQFTLVRKFKEKLCIYNDHLGTKPIFYIIKDDVYYFSNSLKKLREEVDYKWSISSLNVGLHALAFHHINNTTLFEEVKQVPAATCVEISRQGVVFKKYWDFNQLYLLTKNNIPIDVVASQFTRLVANYFDSGLCSKEELSLSLTGGMDTRNILAILLNLGIKPHLYTYGNPKSYDAIVPQRIANRLGLKHIVHDISLTAEIFEQKAKEIIQKGNGIASIHRVHRMMAVEEETKYAKTMFLGTLGGEFIKGAAINDYIIARFIYDWWNIAGDKRPLLERELQARFINSENLDIDLLYQQLSEQRFLSEDRNAAELFALTDITARYHDAQDLNLYSYDMDKVITPFLDLDYLYLLFGSKHTFIDKNRINNPYLRRMQNPIFAANMIKHIYPDLLKDEYSSHYNPKEVLQSIYLTAAKKKVRSRLSKKYPPNFPLGNWMIDFVKNNLVKAMDYSELHDVYNVEQALKQFNATDKHKMNEAYWLKYTNIIMDMFILDEYQY